MSDISHLIRLFYLDSEDQQWRKDMADRVAAQIALLREEHRDYKQRVEYTEKQLKEANRFVHAANDLITEMMQERNEFESRVAAFKKERDELRRALDEARNIIMDLTP